MYEDNPDKNCRGNPHRVGWDPIYTNDHEQSSSRGRNSGIPEVKAILKRACYDCHSHETLWPGYSRVAPASWLLVWDVRKGREELNFSTWNRYGQKKRDKIIKEIWEEVEEGEMPPWFYLPLHPDAQLSDQDHRVLRA